MHSKCMTQCGEIGISLVSYYLKEEEKEIMTTACQDIYSSGICQCGNEKKSSINGVFLRCDLECGK